MVLSTNIAESSITIPDVTHVLDTVLHKALAYDDRRRIQARKPLPEA